MIIHSHFLFTDFNKWIVCKFKNLPLCFDNVKIERLQTACKQWDCLSQDQVHHSSLKWWEAWLDDLAKIRDNRSRHTIYIESRGVAAPQLPRQVAPRPEPPNSDADPAVPKQLRSLLEQETIQPEARTNFASIYMCVFVDQGNCSATEYIYV